MIECKLYTLSELRNALNIPVRQWERRRDDLLEYFKLFFDYDYIFEGHAYTFNIKEQYCEYEPIPRKTKFKEISDFYAKETDSILAYKPRNTGANVAREICNINNQYDHKPTTAANYIRPYIKKNYLIQDKEWCRIDYNNNTYNVISPEQLKFLKSLFEKYLSTSKVADAIGDFESGYASKEQAFDKLHTGYNEAISDFKKRYGFRPYKAGELHKIINFCD